MWGYLYASIEVVEIRFRSRESLFLDQNHTGSASLIAVAGLFTRNDNSITSIFKYLDRHSHCLTMIIFSTNPTTLYDRKSR